VQFSLETGHQRAKLADGVEYEFWTFNGTVPGPMLRVRTGDTVELTLKNTGSMAHSIDLHAVTGPGGGAAVTQVPPGQEATFKWKALNPGLYVYHCATPVIPWHVANGMYGLILVEPEQGLPPVDREFYVMEGDMYTQGANGEPGLQSFSMEKMMREAPEYVVFNGAVGSLTGDRALKAEVGEKIRIFFGAGGPNYTSSFHVIGEIFDTVYPEGASEAVHNVQTTLVPAGGATIAEFTAEVPGTYLIVDHSLTRILKGAVAQIAVAGPENPDIFQHISGGSGTGGH
jgi:nitrite reductase (NO-forming)